MNRLNYVLKTAFLLFTVLILTSTVYTTVIETSDVTETSISTKSVIKSDLSSVETRLYNYRKERIQEEIQSYFKRAINKGLIVGVGISIVKGDSVLLSSGFGRRKINSTNKVNGETVFRLGSLSKGFAGVLVGKLKSEGLVQWEDKVSNYVPEFNFNNHSYTNKITVSHILSHTSGAPYHSYTDLIEGGVALNKIASRFKTVKPISEPGELYSYQNAMFALSGMITQCLTGNSVDQDLKSYFFEPLEMNSTITDYKSLLAAENVAFPHKKYRKTWRSIKLTDKYYNAIPAGGVSSSALDMAKWMRFLLGHNETVMSTNELSEVFKPVVKIGGNRKYYQRWEGHQASYYGYGWRIHKFKSETDISEKTMIHHGGSINNFRNEIALFPEEDLGICVLFNSMPKLAKQVIPDIHKIVSAIYSETAPGEEGLAAN